MRLEEAVEAGLGRGGAKVVLAEDFSRVNFRLANNTVTTNGREDSSSAGVVAVEQDQVGAQSADITQAEQVVALAQAARERARQSPKAPDALPLLESAEAAQPQEQVGGPVGPEDLDPLLGPVGELLERSRSRELRCFGYAQATATRQLLGTAAGVRLEGWRRAASFTLTLKSQDLKQSVWAGGTASSLGQLDPLTLYQSLEERLGWSERQVSLPAGHYQVLLEPSATSDFLLRLIWEMHARGADEGRTVFATPAGTRVGERMYAEQVTLESDPADPEMAVPGFVRSLGSSEYSSVFDNGLAVPPTTWVDQGVQQELICPRRWARDHRHPVRPDCDNLRMRGGEASLEEMIRSTERALLLTSLWYIRDVDESTLLLTGLTRDGVFLIEKGEVVGAVNNFRFNESPVGVLHRTVEIGRTELALSREAGDEVFLAAPPIRVENFFMSSVSDAV